MQVTLEVTSYELTLFYLLTANASAGEIIKEAVRKDIEINGKPPRAVRGPSRKREG